MANSTCTEDHTERALSSTSIAVRADAGRVPAVAAASAAAAAAARRGRPLADSPSSSPTSLGRALAAGRAPALRPEAREVGPPPRPWTGLPPLQTSASSDLRSTQLYSNRTGEGCLPERAGISGEVRRLHRPAAPARSGARSRACFVALVSSYNLPYNCGECPKSLNATEQGLRWIPA